MRSPCSALAEGRNDFISSVGAPEAMGSYEFCVEKCRMRMYRVEGERSNGEGPLNPADDAKHWTQQ